MSTHQTNTEVQKHSNVFIQWTSEEEKTLIEKKDIKDKQEDKKYMGNVRSHDTFLICM